MNRIDLVSPDRENDLSDDRLAELHAAVDRTRPLVRVNFVSSLDGAVTREGRSGGLSSVEDKRVFDVLRRVADAVLVGAGTVRSEGYGAMRVGEADVEWRRKQGLPPHPVFAIASGSLDLDPSSAVFAEAPVRPVVLTTRAASAGRRRDLSAVAEVVDCGDESLDAGAIRMALIDRGLAQVICEGGPQLFGSFLAADAVDELCLSLAPTLEAGDAGRIATGAIPAARGMRLAHVLEAGDLLMLRYTRSR